MNTDLDARVSSATDDSIRVRVAATETVHVGEAGDGTATAVVATAGSVGATVQSAEPEVVVVQLAAVQGPQGPPGRDGDGSVPDHTFAFGDAAQAVYAAPDACRLVRVVLTIRTAFNGTSPAVLVGRFGTAPTPSDMMDATDADAAAIGIYEVDLDYPLSPGDVVWITTVPGGGGNAGTGVLTIYVVPPA